MRTQSILLVRDTILLLNILPTDGERNAFTPQLIPAEILTSPAPGIKLGLWRQSCDRTLASLEEFSQSLLGNAKRFRVHGDKNGADVISSSCIACLAHLAVLYEVVGRSDPITRETCNLCDSALQRLGMFTYELQLDEYTYIDLLLGVRISICYFPAVVTQTGHWGRILGRNRYQSLTSA